MRYVLKEMTEDEKPREKLKKYGPKSLANYELLAVMLKTGTKNKSVIDLSIEVLEYFENLSMISELTVEELLTINGIGEAKALSLMASIEFANRLLKGNSNSPILLNSNDIYNHVKYDLVNSKQEKLICIYVDSKFKVIVSKVITIGSLTQNDADIKTCIKWGLKYSCYGIIFVHNHPSGDCKPSLSDNLSTERWKMACKSVDIAFVDHLVVGRMSYYSYSLKRIIEVGNDK